MQTNFHNELPPQFDKVQVSINKGSNAPLSFAEAREDFINRCAPIVTHFGSDTKCYHLKGKPESVEKIFADSVSVGVGAHGNFVMVLVDKCTLGTSKDGEGKSFTCRIHEVKRSAQGEPVFPSELIALWRFCEIYEPDGSWCLPGEWKAILAECKQALADDKKNDLEDAVHREKVEGQLRQSKAAELNPHEALASGIAKGVAAALIQLGITPNINASKP